MDDDVAEEKVSKKQANTYAAKKTVAQGNYDLFIIHYPPFFCLAT